MKAPYLDCAQVVNIHGFRGVCKLESHCDSPKDLAKFKCLYEKKGETYFPLQVESASIQKSWVLVKFQGIDNEESATAMRGKTLYVKREDLHLQEGKHLVQDLIGLDVLHAETEEKLGVLEDVDTTAFQPLYIIKTEKGVFQVPAVPTFVKKIDEEKGIYLLPIEGLLGDENEV